MSDTAPTIVDDVKDFGSGKPGASARWRAELRAYKRAAKPYLDECGRIERRYRDEPSWSTELDERSMEATRINVLWSNTQIMMPALYARPPAPIVMRRFRDKDQVARLASNVLKRCIDFVVEDAEIDDRIRTAVSDYALYARGVLWAVYEPLMQGDDVAWETIRWDFVHRADFLHGPGITWPDVDWVGRILRYTREDGVEQFGAKFRDVALTWRPGREDVPEDQAHVIRRAEVAEIWCRSTRSVYFIGDPWGEGLMLQSGPLPLNLRRVFPCPKPMFGTMTTGSLIPVPDFTEYRSQATEMDTLTQRIAALSSAIRMNFAYDSEFPELAQIFDDGLENAGIAVSNYAALATKGGMEGAMSFVPIQPMIATLASLVETRASVKNDLYEITGISDIIRGSSSPNETAEAQRIKGRYATLRLSDRQTAVARFVRDVLEITGEIICDKFGFETIAEMSNFMEMEHNGVDPIRSLIDVVELLRNDRLRGFRIDIEDDSTLMIDDEMEKRARTEFLAAIGGFIQSAATVPPDMAPALLPMLGQLVMFGARGFRVGSEVEGAIEEAMGKLKEMLEKRASAPPQPSPEAIKAQAEAQKMQAEMQRAQMETQAQLQVEGIKAQAIQSRAQADMAVANVTLQIRQIEAQRAMARLQADAAQAGAQNDQDATEHALALDEAQMQRADMDHRHAVDWAKIGIEEEKLEASEEE